MTITCQECGRSFKQITQLHLKKTHGISHAEYLERYPGSPIVDPDTAKAISSSLKGRVRTQEHRDRLSESIQQGFKNGRVANRGKIISPESIAKQQTSLKKSIETNGGGFATGPRSDALKERMSEIARNRTEEEWGPKVEAMREASCGRVTTEEQRENCRNARLAFMRDNPDKTPKRMFDTVPELEFEEELKKLRVKYRKQFHTSKPHFLYDFLIEEHTIVEIDGPYHYNPKLHSSVELFEKRQQIDALKNMVAGEKGYNIIRLEVGQHLPGNWRDILLIQGWNICQL